LTSERGQAPVFVVLNAASEPVEFTLPCFLETVAWTKAHDTSPRRGNRNRLMREAA
jgi:hypothetical protein